MIYLGQVIGLEDKTDGERIKVRVEPLDKRNPDIMVADSFPYLPKFLHIKPKVGETVAVLCSDDANQGSQRWYLGPIISQPQMMKYDEHTISSTRLLKGGVIPAAPAPSINPETKGAMAKDEDIAIYSRGDTDIILCEKDLRIRCGSRQFSNDGRSFTFNKRNPAFIKLTEHNQPFDDETNTSATIAAENINLISTDGNPFFDMTDRETQIDDKTMQEILDRAHLLPYGDVLVDFLTMFLQMFKSHTHKYANMPPCPDSASKKMDMKYGTGSGEYSDADYDYSRGFGELTRFEDVGKTFNGLGEKLLSKHVRIN